MKFSHTTVLQNEMVSHVLTNTNGTYVDCTLGGGGHSLALAEGLSNLGCIIGVDQDGEAIEAAKERLRGAQCKFISVRDNFSNINGILKENGIEKVDGFIFDLGVSSHQLDDGARGFSYMNNGKLDMRMDQRNSLTAYDVINTYTEEHLRNIIRDYGEERWASRIVDFIDRARMRRPISTTEELVHVIKAAIPSAARRDGPHPAKRTFQAIRVEVNNELGILRKAMEDCINHLNKGGRLGVITFHSLEDRIIKNTFRDMSKDCICPSEIPICICNHRRQVRSVGKAIRPSPQEVKENPRARSVSLLFIPVLALYFFSGMNAQQEYKMQVLRSEVISIAKENATLQLDVAKLEAPARIQNIAETQLGMQVATSAIYGRMETEGEKQKIRD